MLIIPDKVCALWSTRSFCSFIRPLVCSQDSSTRKVVDGWTDWDEIYKISSKLG